MALLLVNIAINRLYFLRTVVFFSLVHLEGPGGRGRRYAEISLHTASGGRVVQMFRRGRRAVKFALFLLFSFLLGG